MACVDMVIDMIGSQKAVIMSSLERSSKLIANEFRVIERADEHGKLRSLAQGFLYTDLYLIAQSMYNRKDPH